MNEKLEVVAEFKFGAIGYLSVLAGALLAMAAAGCGAADSSTLTEEALQTEDYESLGEELSASASGLPLPGRDQAHTVIKVCWKDLDPA